MDNSRELAQAAGILIVYTRWMVDCTLQILHLENKWQIVLPKEDLFTI
jgi:hypothetical protein